MTQYENSTSVPSDVVNVFANKIPFGRDFIIMQTGENIYTLLVREPFGDDAKSFVCTRNGTYNSRYNYTEGQSQTFEYSYFNENAIYSNVNVGRGLTLPVESKVSTFALCVCTSLVALYIFFGGVWKWFTRRK